MPKRWVSLLISLALLCFGSAVALAAGIDDNPCKQMFDNRRGLRGFPKGSFIYDGFSNLAARPGHRITLGRQFIGPYKSGCVVFEVRFDNNGRVVAARERYQYPVRISSMAGSYSQEARRVMAAIGNFTLLPRPFKAKVPYLLAIPLYADHPFFRGGGGTGQEPATAGTRPVMAGVVDQAMAERGYPDAELVAQEGDTRVFHLLTKGNQDIFAILKTFAPDEPFLDFRATGKVDRFGKPILDYGPKTMAEFKRLVAPHMRAHGTLLAAEVRYYAKNALLAYDHRPHGAEGAVHPKTFRPVANPVAVAHFFAPARRNQATEWSGVPPFGGGRGVVRRPYQTLSALLAAYRKANRSKAEKRRVAQAALEAARAKYPAGKIPERLWTQKERQSAAEDRIRAEEAARDPGFVYKSDRFWARLPDFDIPRMVFEGNFSFQIRRRFPAHFLTFLTLYSDRCRAQIRDPVTEASAWDEVTKQGNREISRVHYSTSITMERRFYPKYKEYEALGTSEDVGRLIGMLLDRRPDSGSGMLDTLGQMIKREKDGLIAWASFFDVTPCESATMTQMRENLLRAANGQPSLQKAGKTVAGASRESESNLVPVEKMTFFDACHAYFLYEKQSFCQCLYREAQGALSPAERKRFSRNFSAYVTEVMDVEQPPPGGDPYWRLSRPLRACRN